MDSESRQSEAETAPRTTTQFAPEVAPGFEIRPFRTFEDYKDCVRLQEETWGAGFSERVSLAILKVSQRLGGVASGAYDDAGLAGFVFGMTGWEDGAPVHWSDMLAVRRDLRNSGLGRTLKWHQRAVLLERGVRKMYWTFDPLVSRNGHLNLNRLGAVVREYAVEMYGQTDSPLHVGIGTDRFVPVWQMDSEPVRFRWEEERLRRVRDADAGGAPAAPTGVGEASEARADAAPTALGFEIHGGLPCPTTPSLDRADPVLAVCIPGSIVEVQEGSLEVAVAWRAATRAVFSEYLARGYEVRELLRGQPCSRYLMYRNS